MSRMVTLRVFTDESGRFGNHLGIIIDGGRKLDTGQRQHISRQCGYSETVFINNIKECNISIFSPQGEIPFAGHATVGAAFFLNQRHHIAVSHLNCMKGRVDVWQENGTTWVRGELALLPAWNFEQFPNPSSVEKIKLHQSSSKKAYGGLGVDGSGKRGYPCPYFCQGLGYPGR